MKTEASAQGRAAEQAAPAGILVELPEAEQKCRPVAVTLRIREESRDALQALAEARGMSLARFCGRILDGVAAQAAERGA
jgi:hypothetical protein